MELSLQILTLIAVVLTTPVVQATTLVDTSCQDDNGMKCDRSASQFKQCDSFCNTKTFTFEHTLKSDKQFCCTLTPNFEPTEIKKQSELAKSDHGTVYKVSILNKNAQVLAKFALSLIYVQHMDTHYV